MARHSYSHGGAADGEIIVVLALFALLRLAGLVFRVLANHFFNPAILVSLLLCFVSAAGLGFSIGWQWVDNNWWYWNIYLWNIPFIAGGVLAASVVVFIVCCGIVDVYFDDTARIGGDDLIEVMSTKWKY